LGSGFDQASDWVKAPGAGNLSLTLAPLLRALIGPAPALTLRGPKQKLPTQEKAGNFGTFFNE